MTPGARLDRHDSGPHDSQDQSARPKDERRMNTAVLLLPVHLFLIVGWGRAAAEKVIDPRWWTSQALREFLAAQRPHMLPWFGWLSDNLLVRFAPQVAITVLGMQIGIVICLVTNHRVRQALWAGVVLNVCFTMAGKVNPSAFYLVMQLTMLFALSRSISREVALRRAGIWLSIAAVVLPFAETVHPRDVIDDPALMLAFVASLAAVTTLARSIPIDEMVAMAERTAVGRSAVEQLRRRVGFPGGTEQNLKKAVVDADSSGNGWDRYERD